MSLDINIKNQLSQFLELIEKPVILSLSLAEDKTSVELRDFVTEVASMTDMIKVDEKSLDLKPSF
ncbi:MAG: alkyl hydroperoxide reductase subunit F, partial [Peptoniphilaceae bacterium]